MTAARVDAVVVGAGFAGLRMLHELRDELGLSVAVLDESADIGGVWYWNRYPGARCDVESFDYSYAFSEALEQEWRWSERYATQPEILSYIDHVADRFDLRRDIHCSRRVSEARYDEDATEWTVETEGGETWRCRYLVLAVGQLSTTKAPELPGQSDFAGEIHHSARWPQEGVDLSGRRAGIIGTGSSGTQMVPIVAEQADHLTVFQRTPNFSIPASHRPISDAQDAEVKAHYRQRRERARNSPSGLGFPVNEQTALEASPEERRALYEQAWPRVGFGFILTYPDLVLDARANDTAADFIRQKIAEKVGDPATRETLTPRGYPFGTKRPPVDDGYFETFNRDDVTLVDVRADPIRRVTATGIDTASGHHRLDVLVLATGFDALTGSLLRMRIAGRGGVTLRETWAAGPVSYLGVGVGGFPNLFVVAGPQSPSLLINVLVGIEQHAEWLGELIRYARERGVTEIEVDPEAQARWVAHVAERADRTLYPQSSSYYNGDEIAGKPRVFMPYVGGARGYRRILERETAAGYPSFHLRTAVRA